MGLLREAGPLIPSSRNLTAGGATLRRNSIRAR